MLKPESSAREHNPEILLAYLALIKAFSLKVLPFSSGAISVNSEIEIKLLFEFFNSRLFL